VLPTSARNGSDFTYLLSKKVEFLVHKSSSQNNYDLGIIGRFVEHLSSALGVTKFNIYHCYEFGHTLLCCLSLIKMLNKPASGVHIFYV
jgi:hypothetical protein